MSDDGDTTFPGLPFDWYTLEKWDSTVSVDEIQQRRQKHIELGIAYAALGHEGRRPYVLKALEWRRGDKDINSLPRSVPRDLLTSFERESGHDPLHPFLIRTDYGPGTDARFAQLVKAHEDEDCLYVTIANDEKRYELTNSDDRAIFAFMPFQVECFDVEYQDDYLPFDSPEIQTRLFGEPRDHEMGVDPEDIESWNVGYFFVADSEAMRTGFLRWVVPNQYGKAIFDERVQPWSLRDIRAIRERYTLEELRQKVSWNHYGDDPDYPNYSDNIVGPWQPPSNLPFR